MTLERARIIKAASLPEAVGSSTPRVAERRGRDDYARRVPRELFSAKVEAEALLAHARAEAATIVASAHAETQAAAEHAAREATANAEARAAARHLALVAREAHADARALDRVVDLAVILAERLVGDAIAKDPAHLGSLARAALAEARGARRVRVEVRSSDVDALAEALAPAGEGIVEVVANDDLDAGSLLVDSDIGRIDGRLRPQLTRLAAALRAILDEPAGGAGSSEGARASR